jgi:hypothetical protein
MTTRTRWSAVLALALSVAGSVAAAARDDALGWSPFMDERTGFAFDYPTKLFALQQGDPTDSLGKRTAVRSGRAFRSMDGQAWLQVAAFANVDRTSLRAFSDKTADNYAKARITLLRRADDHFVVSGTRGAEIFYERVMFSCGGRLINVWQLSYPAAARDVYDPVVEEIARTFRPGREGCQRDR